jgi:hypothetical protein
LVGQKQEEEEVQKVLFFKKKGKTRTEWKGARLFVFSFPFLVLFGTISNFLFKQF